MSDVSIQIPIGDYKYEKFSAFCKHFGCTCEKPKRGDVYFTIKSKNPVNFFWLGCNLNLFYKSCHAITTAAKIFGMPENNNSSDRLFINRSRKGPDDFDDPLF